MTGPTLLHSGQRVERRGPVAAGAWRRGTHAADIGAEEVADLGGEDVAVAGVGAERHPHPVLGQPGAVCAAASAWSAVTSDSIAKVKNDR